MEVTDTQAFSDRLLPFAQARGLVGISRSQIYVLLEKGEFPKPVKVGRTNYFSANELQAWIEKRLSQRTDGQ
ncbi:MAG TPA: hypothetical protein DIU07_10685 [Rhodobacteraceae bacterium]|nr:hypothetical protein [Paracoccaceae bacterium]